MPQFVDSMSAARIIGVSVRQFRRYVGLYSIESTTINRKLFFKTTDIERFKAQLNKRKLDKLSRKAG